MKILNKMIKSIAMTSLVFGSVSLYAETVLQEQTTTTNVMTYGSGMGQSSGWTSGYALTSISIVSDAVVDGVSLAVYESTGTACNLAADGGGSPLSHQIVN